MPKVIKEDTKGKLVSMTSDDLNNEAAPLNHELSYELKRLSKADLESKCLMMELTLKDLAAENKRLREEIKNAKA